VLVGRRRGSPGGLSVSPSWTQFSAILLDVCRLDVFLRNVPIQEMELVDHNALGGMLGPRSTWGLLNLRLDIWIAPNEVAGPLFANAGGITASSENLGCEPPSLGFDEAQPQISS